ncbi:MAG TPA: RsmE family RNA methyltransferase [Candidatus Dormibacteraeota bacterium]|nr:RsmE family RNA methyltransferase [Candidatus Dormibacteraeota bacterium]
MPFFFVERDGDRAVIEGDDAAHLTRSLRARPGEEIQAVDPAGFLLTVRLESVSARRVEGVVVGQQVHQPEPAREVIVAVSHLPAASLELVLSRCTEVGAAAFHVVQADRSVARGGRVERWQTIVREAAMLAGRLRVPAVAGPSTLEEVVRERPGAVMLVRGAPAALSEMPRSRAVTLLIGPEGGWTDRELALVPQHAGLGPRNLRADTAAVVATAIAVGV